MFFLGNEPECPTKGGSEGELPLRAACEHSGIPAETGP
jgi:hypothetical protein